MSSVNIGKVQVFRGVEPSKEYALKALEEAAEVFGAWQQWDIASKLTPLEVDDADVRATTKALLNECADVIQATCNLVSALGVKDFSEYMETCRKRNENRGRY